jgi:hypothetical protein
MRRSLKWQHEPYLPIRGLSKTPQVGLLLASQDLEGSALPDTISANQTQHLAWPGCGQSGIGDQC